MSRYEKISGGSGFHGEKYEINLLLYYLMNAYSSEEDFQLSNGNKDKLKLDDIVIETDTYKIFAQAKHIDNEKKKINKNQLYTETGKFSLCVYLKVAFHDIFKQLLKDIQQQLEEISQEEPSTVLPQLNTVSKMINNSFDFSFDEFTSDLKTLQNHKINELLESFQKTSFHLITNVFPNDELTSFGIYDSDPLENFEEIETFYTFNTDKSVEELWKFFDKSEVPKMFLEIFLDKFHLIIITDDALEASIKKSLLCLSSSLGIPFDVIYTTMFELIEKWRSERVGVYLTRDEVDAAYFGYILTKLFKKDLKEKASLLEFDVDSLVTSTNNSIVTLVKTSRSHLIMAQLQRKFEKYKNDQSLFVNPNYEKRNFLIKAFLHRKYTHLVCSLEKDNEEILKLIEDIVSQVEEHECFKKYKRFILFCDENVQLGSLGHRNILEDLEWFEERCLNVKRSPYSLGDKESYYIDRMLTQKDHEFNEKDFLKNVISNRAHFLVISDSPGMGKTSILSSLAVRVNNDNYYWAVIIELNQYTELLENHLEAKTIPELDEFLDIQITNAFERQICEIPDVLLLMVDAFDEISPQYSDIVTKFLTAARTKRNVRAIVVTTRSHLKRYLEINFEVMAFGMKPFSSDDVHSMISKFRRQSLNGINDWYQCTPKNVIEFLNVPLHARMFAELFDQFHTKISPDRLKVYLFELFEAFVNKKRDIFIKEKCKCLGNVHTTRHLKGNFEKFLQFCTQLSIEITFKKDSWGKLGIKKPIDQTLREDICANGILESSHTSFRFVHLSFMEFFLAKCLAEKILDKTNRDPEIFYIIFDQILLNHFVCKQFLEGYLEKNWHLVTEDILEIFGNIATNYDKPISRCFLYEYPFITRLFIEKCNNLVMMDTIFKDIICSGLQHIQIDIISLLVDKVLTVDFRNSEGRNLLHFASKKGSLDLVKMLIKKNKFNINEVDDTGLSPLFLSVLDNRFEITDYLINHGATIDDVCIEPQEQYKFFKRSFPNRLIKLMLECKTDYYTGKYGLHLAAFRGQFDLVKKLIKENADVNEKTDDGWDPLHCATRSGRFEIVKYLVGSNAHVHDLTNFGENMLHLAVQSRNLDLVKYFIDLKVKIDGKLKNGATPLTVAIECKEVMSFDYILEMYTKLKNIDPSSVNEALYFIVSNDYDNDLFKSIHSYHKDKFLGKHEDFLYEAMLNHNTVLMKYILTKNLYDKNLKTKHDMNYLHRGALIGNFNVMKVLINHSKVEKGKKSAEGKTELHYAVESKNLDIVRFLMDLKMDIHDKTLYGENILHIAARKGDLNMVKYFVNLNLNVNEKTLNHETVFLYAAITGNVALVSYLASLKINIHDRDINGLNAIFYAARRGHLNIVKYLIDLKMNLFEKSVIGDSILHYAAQSGNRELVNYLIALKIPLNGINSKNETILHYASLEGHLNLVKHLINSLNVLGDKNILLEKSVKEETVLHYATRSGNYVLVKHLIGLKMAPNEKTSKGETILHLAALSGKMNLVEYLIDLGMNIKENTLENKTVLHYAAESGNKELVLYLIKSILQVDDKTKNGENVLHFAAQSGNLALFEYLYSLNVKKEEKTLNGQSVLHYAAKSGSLDIMKYLIGLNVDIHEKTLYKETCLHYAVQSKNFEVVKYLIDLKMNVNEKTVNEKTVLHYAAEKGSIEIVNYLIHLGANIDEVSLKGFTVLDYAKEGRNTIVIKYLQSLCA